MSRRRRRRASRPRGTRQPGGLTRREAVKLGALGSLAGMLGALLPREASARRRHRHRDFHPPRRRFLTAAERSTLAAAVDRLIPADEDPGALELGAVDYIDSLLSAFLDYDAGLAPAPRIFGGGPFSGRHGGAPRFGHFLRLSRVQEIAWRMRIEGSRGIPEREFNGPVRGFQEIYREGLADLERRARERFSASFAELDETARERILREADPDFVGLVYQHAVEAMYAPPEYGGNRGLRGWRYIRFEGDRQPVGYSRYDGPTRRYREFHRFPVSRPDPGPPSSSGRKKTFAARTLAEAGLPPDVTNPFAGPRRAAWLRLRVARGTRG